MGEIINNFSGMWMGSTTSVCADESITNYAGKLESALSPYQHGSTLATSNPLTAGAFGIYSHFECGGAYIINATGNEKVLPEAQQFTIPGAVISRFGENVGLVVNSYPETIVLTYTGGNDDYLAAAGEYLLTTSFYNDKPMYRNTHGWWIWWDNDESRWKLSDIIPPQGATLDILSHDNPNPAAGAFTCHPNTSQDCPNFIGPEAMSPPPPPTLTPNNLLVTSDASPTWTWVAATGQPDQSTTSKYKFRILGLMEFFEVPATITSYTAGQDTPLEDGSYVFEIFSIDALGQQSVDSSTSTIVVDTLNPANPAPSIASPTNNQLPTWTWPEALGAEKYRTLFNNQTQISEERSFTPPGPGLAEGEYELKVTAIDVAANESAEISSSVVIDLTKPLPPIITGNTPTQIVKPIWNWEVPDAEDKLPGDEGYQESIVEYEVSFAGADSFVTTNTSFQSASNLSDGDYELSVSARDFAGNQGFSASHTIKVDTAAPPAPVLTATTGNVENPRPSWSWPKVLDGATEFYYKFEEGNFQAYAITAAAVYTFSPSAPQFPGTYDLTVYSQDAAGNKSAEVTLECDVDLTPPNPPNPTFEGNSNTATNNPYPTWTWAGTSTESVTYEVRLENPIGTSTQFLTSGPETSYTYNPAGNQAGLSDASYKLLVFGEDVNGNESGWGEFVFVVDTVPPGIPTPSAPSPTNNPKPTWSWPLMVGAVNYEYQLDGNGATGLQSGFTTDLSYESSGSLPDSTYTFRVRAIDLAGNVSVSWGTATTLIDTTNDEVAVVTVTESPTRNPRPTWSWSVSAAGTYEFRHKLDDAAWADNWSATTTFTPSSDLPEGVYTLHVETRDDTENVSAAIGFGSVQVDTYPGSVVNIAGAVDCPTGDNRHLNAPCASCGVDVFANYPNNANMSDCFNLDGKWNVGVKFELPSAAQFIENPWSRIEITGEWVDGTSLSLARIITPGDFGVTTWLEVIENNSAIIEYFTVTPRSGDKDLAIQVALEDDGIGNLPAGQTENPPFATIEIPNAPDVTPLMPDITVSDYEQMHYVTGQGTVPYHLGKPFGEAYNSDQEWEAVFNVTWNESPSADVSYYRVSFYMCNAAGDKIGTQYNGQNIPHYYPLKTQIAGSMIDYYTYYKVWATVTDENGQIGWSNPVIYRTVAAHHHPPVFTEGMTITATGVDRDPPVYNEYPGKKWQLRIEAPYATLDPNGFGQIDTGATSTDWDEIFMSTDPAIGINAKSYEIEYGGPGNWTTYQMSSTSGDFGAIGMYKPVAMRLPEFESDTTYQFRARTFSTSGKWSDWLYEDFTTDSVTGDVDNDTTPTKPNVSPKFFNGGNGKWTYNINWSSYDAPSDTNHYRLYVKYLDENSNWVVTDYPSVTGMGLIDTVDVGNLEPGQYMWRLIAVDNADNWSNPGEWSDEITISSDAGDQNAPLPPTAVTATVGVPALSTIGISWTPPTSSEGGDDISDLEKYKVYFTDNPNRVTASGDGWVLPTTGYTTTPISYNFAVSNPDAVETQLIADYAADGIQGVTIATLEDLVANPDVLDDIHPTLLAQGVHFKILDPDRLSDYNGYTRGHHTITNPSSGFVRAYYVQSGTAGTKHTWDNSHPFSSKNIYIKSWSGARSVMIKTGATPPSDTWEYVISLSAFGNPDTVVHNPNNSLEASLGLTAYSTAPGWYSSSWFFDCDQSEISGTDWYRSVNESQAGAWMYGADALGGEWFYISPAGENTIWFWHANCGWNWASSVVVDGTNAYTYNHSDSTLGSGPSWIYWGNPAEGHDVRVWNYVDEMWYDITFGNPEKSPSGHTVSPPQEPDVIIPPNDNLLATSFNIENLNAETQYWFTMYAIDDNYNISELSNIASASTITHTTPVAEGDLKNWFPLDNPMDDFVDVDQLYDVVTGDSFDFSWASCPYAWPLDQTAQAQQFNPYPGYVPGMNQPNRFYGMHEYWTQGTNITSCSYYQYYSAFWSKSPTHGSYASMSGLRGDHTSTYWIMSDRTTAQRVASTRPPYTGSQEWTFRLNTHDSTQSAQSESTWFRFRESLEVEGLNHGWGGANGNYYLAERTFVTASQSTEYQLSNAGVYSIRYSADQWRLEIDVFAGLSITNIKEMYKIAREDDNYDVESEDATGYAYWTDKIGHTAVNIGTMIDGFATESIPADAFNLTNENTLPYTGTFSDDSALGTYPISGTSIEASSIYGYFVNYDSQGIYWLTDSTLIINFGPDRFVNTWQNIAVIKTTDESKPVGQRGTIRVVLDGVGYWEITNTQEFLEHTSFGSNYASSGANSFHGDEFGKLFSIGGNGGIFVDDLRVYTKPLSNPELIKIADPQGDFPTEWPTEPPSFGTNNTSEQRLESSSDESHQKMMEGDFHDHLYHITANATPHKIAKGTDLRGSGRENVLPYRNDGERFMENVETAKLEEASSKLNVKKSRFKNE